MAYHVPSTISSKMSKSRDPRPRMPQTVGQHFPPVQLLRASYPDTQGKEACKALRTRVDKAEALRAPNLVPHHPMMATP